MSWTNFIHNKESTIGGVGGGIAGGIYLNNQSKIILDHLEK